MVRILIAVMICLSVLQMPAFAKDPFELTIRIYRSSGDALGADGIYINPTNNAIKISGTGYVPKFKVFLKNVSSSTQSIAIDSADKGLGQIIFDATDESGNTNLVTKKIDLIKSKNVGYTYLAPGKAKEFEISLVQREWDNAFRLVEKGASKIKVRACYKNGSNTIYSDYYTIIME